MRTLFISYDGALDPLGYAQVLPYLEGLSKKGHQIDLLSFEKPARWEDLEARSRMEARLSEAEITWLPQRYRSHPPVFSTALNLLEGVRVVGEWVKRTDPDFLHCRSYPSALLGALIYRRFGVPFIFDMRGMYPEDRVDGGLWREGGVLYHFTKRLEAWFLRDARAIVTLTNASVAHVTGIRDAVGGRGSIHVIPTCADLDRFYPRPRSDLFRLAYFGSLGTWYLLDEMLRFAGMALEEAGGGSILFLTNDNPGDIRSRAAANGLDPANLDLASVPHHQVPDALAGCWATFFFIKQGRSRLGFHQTKLGESLAGGLPVVAPGGVGDVREILEGERVGVVVDDFEDGTLRAAARAMIALCQDHEIGERCRKVAEERYDRRLGVDLYDRLYRQFGMVSKGWRSEAD